MPAETAVSPTLREAIQGVNRTLSERFSGGDAAGVARCYTADAIVMPPNHDLIQGRNDIEGFWRGVITAGVKAITLHSQNTEQYGELIAEIGRFTIVIEDNQIIDEGKYLVLWKQENGEWKLFRDIWNSSRPVPKP